MRLLDTEVKYIDSDSVGIPKLTNSWGCLIDFLDATLVNGSEPQEILNITTKEDEVYPDLYWIATLTVGERHGFKENLSVISITDSSDPIYNGEFRVQEVTPTTISIAFLKSKTPTIPTPLEHTLGIKLKLAPLGYQKAFEGPQKAAYKVTTKDDKYCYLRVDNSCPVGHDPSWAKFGRVSMLSDMNHIDDYEFRLGRQKAPAWPEDYNKAEREPKTLFLYTRYSSSEFNIRQPPSIGQGYYALFGDSNSFIYHMECVLYYDSDSYRTDVSDYIGLYNKLIYKEDPLPFILTATEIDYSNYRCLYYNSYDTLTTDRNLSKHTFNTETQDLFNNSEGHRFTPWFDDNSLSGQNTRISCLPYKNEINLNLMPFYLRMFRKNNTTMEGQYRGVKAIMSNIADYPQLVPQNYKVFKEGGNFYIRIPDRSHYRPNQCYALQLNNWE